MNWIKIGDTEKDGKYIFSTKERIKPEGVSKSRFVKSGDFLLTNSMSFGRPYILKTEGCIHDGWLVIGDIDLIFDQDYLYYALSAKYMYQTMSIMAGGSTVDNLNSDLVKSLMFPIPPINEQKYIARKVSDLLELVESIKSNEETIGGEISLIKAKILDLAIQGKLVSQDPNDEPASVLLERIREEKEELIKAGKIKRDKKESVIFKGDDNSYYEKVGKDTNCINEQIPFELPASWCWCRLGSIFSHNTGKALNSSNTEGRLLTYITTSNLYWDRFELETLKEMLFTDSELEKYTVKKGDLLVCEGGDIGRSAIWCYEDEMRIQNHIHRLRPYVNLSNRFYYYVLWLWKQIGLIGGQGIGLQGFSSKAIHNLIIPLPPLNEQNRITHMIDELLGFLDTIEQHLS